MVETERKATTERVQQYLDSLTPESRKAWWEAADELQRGLDKKATSPHQTYIYKSSGDHCPGLTPFTRGGVITLESPNDLDTVAVLLREKEWLTYTREADQFKLTLVYTGDPHVPLHYVISPNEAVCTRLMRQWMEMREEGRG